VDLEGECSRNLLKDFGGVVGGAGAQGDFNGELGSDCAVLEVIGCGDPRIICGKGGG